MALTLPAFALQTLVENCFKHNYFTEKSPLKISITHLEGKLSICNNLALIKVKNVSCTGLDNLSKRYKLIAGEHIEVRQNALEFCVTIPLLYQ